MTSDNRIAEQERKLTELRKALSERETITEALRLSLEDSERTIQALKQAIFEQENALKSLREAPTDASSSDTDNASYKIALALTLANASY